MANSRGVLRKALPWLLACYALASFAHFAHNAEYLAAYPNLPGWLSRSDIYLTWCTTTVIGVVGYWLQRGPHAYLGLAVLTVYAALGFDGLLHYQRAPMMAHTVAMNVTIWTEAMTAAAVLAVLVLKAWKSRMVN